MSSLLRFAALLLLKWLSKSFYRFQVSWLGASPRNFDGLRLVVILNHTSLFEPMFAAVLPHRLLWQIARHGAFPGADITLNRPWVGRLFKAMAPTVVSITRKRDASWDDFMDTMGPDTIVLILPEGRMKRPGGLDKDGKPMTVRSGVVDILQRLDQGRLLIAISAGLHHIHTPGQGWPHLWQTASIAFENIAISDYKKAISAGLNKTTSDSAFRKAVVSDLERRRDEALLLMNGRLDQASASIVPH